MQTGTRCALLIAHPGHEVRVHGWLEAARPTVYILTDGSGFAGNGRLDSTTKLLARAGAKPGSIYGRFTDRQIYDAVLARERDLFLNLAHELADALMREQFELVVGDAAEGAILTHDLWRGVIDCALSLAEQRTGRRMRNYDFCLEGTPLAGLERQGGGEVWRLDLNQAAWQRKLAAARSYPELREEVERAFAKFGEELFATEVLCSTANSLTKPAAHGPVPHYERHGESQVELGKYPEVIRFREHVAPILQALASQATAREAA